MNILIGKINLARYVALAVLSLSLQIHDANAATPDGLLEQKRQEERDVSQRQTLQRQADVHLQAGPESGSLVLPLNEKTCFPITRIEMPVREATFNDVLNNALAHITPQPQGQCLGVQGINAVVNSIQNELIRQGYVTTRVLVPQQDLRRGVLQLQLIPGRIAAIQFKTDPSIQVHAIRVALPMQEGDVLNLRDVEQALENFKRVPTVEADIQIEPADLPGQSNLVVMYQQKLPLRLLVSADDSGTKATGRYLGA